jgi:site-specific DNA recombinase
MIEQKFDPKLPYRFVTYARMSSEAQNPRSPDQQFATIHATIQRQGYPWVEVETFRDDAISGRYVWRRPGFSEMIQRIKTGSIRVDLIIVDTFERLGRSDELSDIRRQLAIRYGVLVVSGDTGFADPTTAMGRVMAAFESARATDANRVKSHDVVRGKIDAVKEHKWPGGSPPFGFTLKSVFTERYGRQVVDYSLLIPDPDTAWIVKKLFALAAATGSGATLLAVALNNDPTIPDQHKPFLPSTVGRRLENQLYVGTYVWNRVSCDIVEDIRILEPNDHDEIIVEPGFCDSLIDAETWSRVQQLRQARSERSSATREHPEEDEKLFKPLVPGVALRYPLSGLIVCAACRRAMTISSGAEYKTKAGEIRRYQAYFCPGSLALACSNKTRISEEWLRREVVGRLNQHFLFPGGGGCLPDSVEAVQGLDWFVDLQHRVQQEVDRRQEAESKTGPDVESELNNLARQICGWQQSLGKPDLDPQVRQFLEGELSKAIRRQAALREQLEGERRATVEARTIVDPQAVLDRLGRIETLLQSCNPSELNVELAYLIDRITCANDGTVSLRMCRFGLVPELTEFLRKVTATQIRAEPVRADNKSGNERKGTPRRRSIRRVDNRDAARFVADPDRFADVPDEWFWVDTFRQRKRKSWAETRAQEVHSARFAPDGTVKKTYRELEVQFGVTKPTLMAALRIAQERRAAGGDTSSDDAD